MGWLRDYLVGYGYGVKAAARPPHSKASLLWLGGSGAAIRRGAGGGRDRGRRRGWDLRLGRRIRGGLARGDRGRAEDWRCESPGRRTGGCRKIRRGREVRDRFRRFRNRWRCA